MSSALVAFVLTGALLHASWNALVKSSADKALDSALIHALRSVVAWPLLAWVGLPPPEALPFVCASAILHLAYYSALVGAYRHGDLSLGYPIMRGASPLLVAFVSSTALGENLSLPAWIGVLAISTGVLLLAHSGGSLTKPKAVGFALLNAGVIALYTLVDALGARTADQHGGHSLQYIALLFALDGWAYAALVMRKRLWTPALGYARRRLAWSLGGACASAASYAIALWAMTLAPVAAVAALRETSVLFAAILGALLLGERISRGKILGTLSILGGVLALRLG